MTKDAMSAGQARVAELDGIRGIAIGLILVWHYFANQIRSTHGVFYYASRLVATSWSGVDLFFVLSGFLIGGILWDNRSANNVVKTFYVRRFLRIFPLYFSFLFVFIGLNWAWSARPEWLFQEPLPIWSYATYAQNFVMASRDTFGPHWLAITWSLAIEEQFYVLLPPLILLLPPRAAAWVFAVLAASALLIRGIVSDVSGSALAPYVLLPCRWDSLFFGVIGAVLVRNRVAEGIVQRHSRKILQLWGVLGGGVAYFTYKDYPWNGWTASVMFTWFGLFFFVLLLLAVELPRAHWLRRLLRVQPLCYLGTIAYGVYLLHEAIVGLVHYFFAHQRPQMINPRDALLTTLALCATIGLAHLSFKYFESPLLKIGHRMRYNVRRSVEPAVAVIQT